MQLLLFHVLRFDLELTEENIDTYGCKLGGENNMCACTGGTAVEGRECPKNGWEMCESCDEPNVIRVLITEGEGAGHIVCETNCRFEYGGENTCDTEIEDGGTCSSATSKGMDCTGCKHCSDHKGEYPYACNSEYDAPDERGCCGGDGRENCPFFFWFKHGRGQRRLVFVSARKTAFRNMERRGLRLALLVH